MSKKVCSSACFGELFFADSYAHLLPVVQALVVVLEHGAALLLAGVVFSRGVDDVAGEHILPEGKAS